LTGTTTVSEELTGEKELSTVCALPDSVFESELDEIEYETNFP